MNSEVDQYIHTPPLTDINITPLVDVTMVILIIFILVAPMMEQGITVKLPATEAKPLAKEKPITISIAKDKKIYIGNIVTSLHGLELDLSNMALTLPDKPIVLRADKDLPYELIVKVLDVIQKSGIAKLGLATKVETVKK